MKKLISFFIFQLSSICYVSSNQLQLTLLFSGAQCTRDIYDVALKENKRPSEVVCLLGLGGLKDSSSRVWYSKISQIVTAI